MSPAPAVGARLRSAVCTTEVIVIRLDDSTADIECGGVPMVQIAGAPATLSGSPRPGFDQGSLLGKRYGSSGDPVELLCTKAGAGSLSIGDQVLDQRKAAALPSSD